MVPSARQRPWLGTLLADLGRDPWAFAKTRSFVYTRGWNLQHVLGLAPWEDAITPP